MTARTRRVSYANVASTLALVVAVSSGGAYAAGLAKNSVGSKQIKNHAVKAIDLKAGSVGGDAVANGSLTAADLAAGTVPKSLPGRIVVRRVDVSLPPGPGAGSPGAEVDAFATCLAGEKLIGGSVNVGSPTGAATLISRPSGDPTTNGGEGDIPTDGGTFTHWKGTARTLTNASSTMRVFAICSTP